MNQTPRSQWWMYAVRCRDGTVYCGISTDVTRRVAAHNAGRGAKYTRSRGPCVLLAKWPCSGHGDALRMERGFKRLSRDAKMSRVIAQASIVVATPTPRNAT